MFPQCTGRPCVYPPLKRQLKLYLTLIQHCGITELNIPIYIRIEYEKFGTLLLCWLSPPEVHNRFLAPPSPCWMPGRPCWPWWGSMTSRWCSEHRTSPETQSWNGQNVMFKVRWSGERHKWHAIRFKFPLLYTISIITSLSHLFAWPRFRREGLQWGPGLRWLIHFRWRHVSCHVSEEVEQIPLSVHLVALTLKV